MQPQRTVITAALLLLALSTARSEAGLIPWSYEWNTRPIVVNADSPNPGGNPTGGIHLIPGAITITGHPPGVAWGSGSIVAVNLTTFSFSPDPGGAPGRFTNTPYQLNVKLTDVDSHVSGSLHFAGVFNGTMTDSTLNLQTRFTSPTKRLILLGHNVYTVTLTSYSPPGPPSVGSEGSISAFVDVHPAHAPEPSSLLLAGTGLTATILTWLRRRIRTSAP
jgi:hypothetical protein